VPGTSELDGFGLRLETMKAGIESPPLLELVGFVLPTSLVRRPAADVRFFDDVLEVIGDPLLIVPDLDRHRDPDPCQTDGSRPWVRILVTG
jgi:hypothetical protein